MAKVTDFEIKAVAREIKQNQIDDWSVGFMGELDGKERWYNLHADQPELIEEMKQTIIQRGNIISFENTVGIATDVTLIKKAETKNGFNNNEDRLDLEKLLSSGHEKGIQSLIIKRQETFFDEKHKPIQSTTTYTLTMKDGCIFEATGDADESNTDAGSTADAIIRMGETRALVRCLRWATNEATAAKEELPKK